MNKLKTKIRLLLSIAIIGVIFLTIISATKDYYETVDSRKEQLKIAVESMYNIAAGYHKLEQEGKMTKEDAQKAARQAIKVARYGGKDGKTEYFYIWDLATGTAVMLPIKPEWDGVKKKEEVKAPNGQMIIEDMLKGVHASPDKKAYIPTLFPRPGQTESVDKLQFVMGFEPWSWMIGSGLYMDDVKEIVMKSITITLVGGLVLLALITITGIYLMKSVIKQIGGEPNEAMELMKKVAQGDLTVNISTKHEGSLMDSVNEMVKSLAELVRHTKNSANEIAVASREISDGNMNLSVRTEQTASNLQQTAASMHQISSSIASSSHSANQAATLTQEANQAAQNGGKVMSEVMTNMESIKNASVKITDITSVIDSIAFQTNILALNAAVEAARAGEQGKGFAVVAAEVRNLAQKSASAAKEIKTLIQDSSNHVKDGSVLVMKASQSMNEIVASVDKVKNIINEIDVSASKQTKGILQVNNSVSQLDGMTQQNAALVEEAAAAAASLNEQAKQLSSLVENFKV